MINVGKKKNVPDFSGFNFLFDLPTYFQYYRRKARRIFWDYLTRRSDYLPVTYLFGDVLTEVYGYERYSLVIWIGFTADLLMSAMFMITIVLPHPAFWGNQAAYTTVLGLTPRLVMAFLMAYFGGEFANSFILSKMKILTKGRWLWNVERLGLLRSVRDLIRWYLLYLLLSVQFR